MEKIRLPYRFTPREYQKKLFEVFDSGIKRLFIVWHRRSGKDKACFNLMIREAVSKVATYFYILPTFSQAKRVVWDNIDNDGFRMLDHIPRELIKSTNATELKIELINGSIIQLIAGNEFKNSIVGTNPYGVVFSEFSINNKDAWQFLSPILAANGGWVIFNMTPRGKNHAWEMMQKMKDNVLWWFQILTVADTNVYTPESLEEERKNNPQDFFDQEYNCKFVDGASQYFRRVRENIYSNDDIPRLPTNGDFQFGIDLAKYNDWTVITPFNRNKFIVYPQDRFNQVDWNLQKARIQVAVSKVESAKVCIDRTGVGDPVVEDLRRVGVNIPSEPFDHAFTFTAQSRENLLKHLAILLEQDKIKLPNDEGLIAELESFRYELSDRGTIKVTVPDGMHDDRVMSLALAVYGNTERVEYTDPRTVMLRDWEQTQRNVKNYTR
jgi:hypothetical protein